MAVSYTVNELRKGRQITVTGTDDSMKMVWTTSYSVDVSGIDPATASAIDVKLADGLPIVNRSTYYFQGKVVPYLICRNKTARQDEKKLSRWVVDCRYEASANDSYESEDGEQDPPASIDDITPRIEVDLDEGERVLYTDKVGKAYVTPVRNFYAEPLVERLAILELKITQYEGFISFDDMLARRFKANEDTYRNQPRYTWFVEDVDAIDARLQLASGEVDVAQVTYTIRYNPVRALTFGDNSQKGWKEERALIDTHHRENGLKKPILDDVTKTETIGFVDANGVLQKNATEPLYEEYEPYDTISFASFLKA